MWNPCFEEGCQECKEADVQLTAIAAAATDAIQSMTAAELEQVTIKAKAAAGDATRPFSDHTCRYGCFLCMPGIY